MTLCDLFGATRGGYLPSVGFALDALCRPEASGADAGESPWVEAKSQVVQGRRDSFLGLDAGRRTAKRSTSARDRWVSAMTRLDSEA
jgi:hypothetical protein